MKKLSTLSVIALAFAATPALAQCVAFGLGLLLMIWQGRRLEVQ